MTVVDYDRYYRLKVTDPGTWPNLGVPPLFLDATTSEPVEAWVSGEDPNCCVVIHGGTAPAREALGIEMLRQVKNSKDGPAEGFVWSEMDFSENYRTLRSLEDFAKREKDAETWNLYVEYERKFHRLMSRELLFFQGLGEFGTVSKFYREHLYNEIIRRITQTQYESPRLTVISTPNVAFFQDEYRSFFEYLSTYTTLIELGVLS